MASLFDTKLNMNMRKNVHVHANDFDDTVPPVGTLIALGFDEILKKSKSLQLCELQRLQFAILCEQNVLTSVLSLMHPRYSSPSVQKKCKIYEKIVFMLQNETTVP